jgi:hypothetical protein
MAEVLVEQEVFTLPNVKIIVKPILREGLWLDKGHSGNWQYDNCYFGITVPIDKNTGGLKEVLTPAERVFFEDKSKSNMDFKPGDLMASRRDKKENFWTNYTVQIQKSEAIVKEESVLFELDLTNPYDYLKYAVLRANMSPLGGSVAPSWGERYNSGTYKIALVKDEETLTDIVNRSGKKKEAYKFVGTLEKSTEEMWDFLSVYWLASKSYKRPPEDSSKEFYIAELEKIIETDLDGFISVVHDKDNYLYKLLIHKAVKLNIVAYSISNGFVTMEGVPLGLTLGDAVSFLKNPKNQEHFIRIDNYVKMNKEK